MGDVKECWASPNGNHEPEVVRTEDPFTGEIIIAEQCIHCGTIFKMG